jgi:putative ABC transport system ATP-binding protein
MFYLREVRHAYNGVPAVSVREWRAEQGDHWLLIGPSGSGKSTLLHLLAGFFPPSHGSVLVAGNPLHKLKPHALDRFRGRHVGIVLQRLHLVASLNVFDNVVLAQYLAGVKQDRQRVTQVLEDLGLAAKAKAHPHELSFGESQRVAVARAVVNRPSVLLADEPTSNLDDERCLETIVLLETAATACQATLLVATHDQRVKARMRYQFTLGMPE